MEMFVHALMPVFEIKCAYLISKGLRWGVSNTTAMRNTDKLSTELQHVRQWQVANIGIILTAHVRKNYNNKDTWTLPKLKRYIKDKMEESLVKSNKAILFVKVILYMQLKKRKKKWAILWMF